MKVLNNWIEYRGPKNLPAWSLTFVKFRIVQKFIIFPRKKLGKWVWGRTKVKQEYKPVPLEFISIMDWVDVEVVK